MAHAEFDPGKVYAACHNAMRKKGAANVLNPDDHQKLGSIADLATFIDKIYPGNKITLTDEDFALVNGYF